MDTIEAINTLANLSGGVDGKASEAINMAIRALEVTADSDTITRKQAIDAVAEGLKHVFVEYRDVAEKMINKIH